MTLRAFATALLCIPIFSCNPPDGSSRLPRHSGEPGEVLVVMNEADWQGEPGDSLRVVLEAYVPFIPQAEPRFSLLHFTHEQMSGLLQQHRNIIQVNIGQEFSENPGIKLTRDKWSKHQVVFSINAPDISTFYTLMAKPLSQAADIIDQTELSRLDSRLYKFKNDDIQEQVAGKFAVDIRVPDDCEIAKNVDDFLWIKRERVKYIRNEGHQITQGFFIYSYPYVSDSAFTQADILAHRDSVLQLFVPGPSEGSYMTTEYRFPPESRPIELNGKYALLTEGLWRTENEFMGGPFVSLTTTNANDTEIICVSGFVFAPKFDKREYIREVEGILRTFKPLSNVD